MLERTITTHQLKTGPSIQYGNCFVSKCFNFQMRDGGGGVEESRDGRSGIYK